jgi:hypothetical protein
MHSSTKTLLAALLCAPITLLIPVHQADACSIPEPGYTFAPQPLLPTLPAQAAIPIQVSGYGGDPLSRSGVSVQVTYGQEAFEIPGTITIIQLKGVNEQGLFHRHNELLIWRPDITMAKGEHQVIAKLLNPRGNVETLSFTITIGEDTPAPQPAMPTLTASLKATPVGAAQTCCPIAKTSSGGYRDTCTGDAVAPTEGLQEPTGALISCGYEVGSACELCWPTRYDAAPTLDTSWEAAAGELPAALTYYEVTLKNGVIEQANTLYGLQRGTDSRKFEVNSADPSYCITVHAISILDGQRVTTERCIDRADMTPLPGDLGAITGVDPRMQCDDHDSADMGSADMGDADMDHSSPGEGEGGCATPGGTSPVAPAMLAAFGLVGWLRRRR